MRDPRLAELEFLMRLEREGPIDVTVPKGATIDMFGLNCQHLREMFSELIEEGVLNGNASAMDKDWVSDMTRNLASDARMEDLNNLRLGRTLTLRLAHKGRRQLFRLRDELRDETREQFGILYNRRAWDQWLAVQLLFATAETPLAILYADVDHFKKLNDTHGHDFGDDVLKRVFTIVRDATGDRAYRWGGEEIAALLPNTDLDSARGVGETIRKAVEQEDFKTNAGDVVRSTLSIGLAAFSAPEGPEEAFRRVDGLLRKAKAGGRNRLEV